MIRTSKFFTGRGHIGAVTSVLSMALVPILCGCHRQPQASANTLVGAMAKGHLNFREAAQQVGILSIEDFTRLDKIHTTLVQNHTMSDADLDFWVALLNRGPLKNTPSNWSFFHGQVLGHAFGNKHLTPSQQKKMFDAVLPYVSDAAYARDIDPKDTDPAYVEISQVNTVDKKFIAVKLLEQTGDPRTVRTLEHVAQSDPSPRIRRTALRFHETGIKSASPP